MTPAEVHAFLDHGTRTAKLATARASGAPHVVPVWFLRDGDDLITHTAVGSVKGKALARDDRVALCVDDEHPPYSFVMIEGRAEMSADPDELLDISTRLAARYMGAENAEAFGRRNADPDERVVRIRVTRVIAKLAVSD